MHLIKIVNVKNWPIIVPHIIQTATFELEIVGRTTYETV